MMYLYGKIPTIVPWSCCTVDVTGLGPYYYFHAIFTPGIVSYLTGVNSGVMLMNLTRMREVKWVQAMIPYHKEYKYRITWGDQDLINIYFHFKPGRIITPLFRDESSQVTLISSLFFISQMHVAT